MAEQTENPKDNSCAPEAVYSLRAYWKPRYWPVWLVWAWIALMARLPFPWQIKIGKRLGRALMPVLTRQRTAAQRNLAICFPELDAQQHRELVIKQFESYGASLAEMGVGWHTPLAKLKKIVHVEGKEHLDAAMADGKGVILFTAHFTCLEVGVAILEDLCSNCGCMYRPQRNEMFDTMILRGRSRFAKRQIDKNNVRMLLQSLRSAMAIAYLPDHTYTGSHSELLPFFGEPTVTNTATSKIARLSGAKVLPYFFRRNADDSGYRVDIGPPLDGFPTEDPVADTARLVGLLEDYIRLAPEQYLWTYRKFKGRPAGYTDVYSPSA
ncbi:MAG: lipid A biosynthesis lauroyl acyltransferase [Gammaproteobacteria bacterium]|nr:lipid A biosynthesis lauroyl acyltransferase [Gammaproteobacteria bacterium]